MKAAVLEEIGKPLRVMNVSMATHGEQDCVIGEDQVLVKMLVAGICGAQLQEIDGLKGDPSHCPHLLGHEGCGIVERAGIFVKHVKRGDKVVIHWRKGEGVDATPPKFGEIKMGPCTTFSEYTIVSSNRITAIPHDVPNDLAALLGCCLSTALATVENVAQIRRDESVLVIGVGGLGLAMILACKFAGAKFIVASDKWEGEKARLAHEIGADFFMPSWWQGDYARGLMNPSKVGEPIEQHPIDYSYDCVIDTTGTHAYDYLLRKDGRYISMTGPGKNSEGGDFNPTRDILRYVQMWRDGKLEGWEKIITHRITLDQINDGITAMRKGQTGRVMIEFT